VPVHDPRVYFFRKAKVVGIEHHRPP
jgi:hypothetical protein